MSKTVLEFEDDIGATYSFELNDNAPLNLCFCDVDGTLSGGVIYHSSGKVSRQYFMRDGAGLRNLLRIENTVPILISGESDPSIWNRALKLKVPFLHAPGRDKTPRLRRFLIQEVVSQAELRIFHIGDDLNDVALMELCDVPACPHDAHPGIKRIVLSVDGFVCVNNGGNGAVREWCDWLCEHLTNN